MGFRTICQVSNLGCDSVMPQIVNMSPPLEEISVPCNQILDKQSYSVQHSRVWMSPTDT